MAFLNVNTIMQVIPEVIVNGQLCMNVFHYVKVGEGGISTLNLEYTEFANKLLGNAPANVGVKQALLDAMGNNASLVRVRLQVIKPIRYTQFIYSTGLPAVGSINAECEAQNLQATIIKRTIFSGRAFRGAFRVAGMPTEKVENGFVDNVYRGTELQDLANKLTASFITPNGDTWDGCLFHRNGHPHNPGAWHTLVDEVEVQDEARTQRTRTVGRGI